MNDRHWVESLYETFMMRDLIGYAGPGSILIMGVLCELGKINFLKTMIFSLPGLALLVVSSYIIASGLRLLGTSLRIVLFHRGWGVFGRGWSIGVDNKCKGKIESVLWRRDESWLKNVYARIPKDKIDLVISRESVFLHLTGLTGMALFTLAGAIFILPHDGLSKLLNISECRILIVLLFSSLIFFLGHYRHVHQSQLLQNLKNNNG